MRSLAMVCVVVCLAWLPTAANAAGQVSDATLAQVNLSAMHPMTDAQGMDVRGSGFAVVKGQSWAAGSGSGANNKYVAVSDPHRGSALAAGASLSFAVKGFGVFNGDGAFGAIFGSAAGGGAIAYAK